MEKIKTTDKVMNHVFEALLTHFEKAKFDVYTKDFQKIICTIRHANPSRRKELICNSINYYFDGYSVRNLPYHPHPFQWQHFLTKLRNRLVELDKGQLQSIYNDLITFQQHVESLHSNINFTSPENVQNWYKTHCYNIRKCCQILQKRLESTDNIPDHVLLNIMQLETLTILTKNLLNDEFFNKKSLTECRKFVQKRFIHIFDAIKKFVDENIPRIQDPGFLQWMDNTLDEISDVKTSGNYDKMQDIKISVEEVLCHAMSIAQICDEENSKKIKAGIYTVLQELKQLEIEIAKLSSNSAYVNLYIDILSDKLCILERRVNNAVLNISLKVFSDPNEPLEKLHNACKKPKIDGENRSQDDLQKLIQEFDFHVDSITQIGLFAISCCTNKIVIGRINSSLASLESLESELVPSLISLYLEPSDIKKCYVDFFINHWILEVQKLRTQVCSIIDPQAFSQVTLEYFKSNIKKMTKINVNEEIVNSLNNKLEVLMLVLNESIKDKDFAENFDIEKIICDLKYIGLEVMARVKKMEDPDSHKRVYKRLLVLATVIKKAIKILSKEQETIAATSEGHHVAESAVADEIELDILEIRGLEILKNRSILYKTPVPVKTPKNCTKKSQRKVLGASFIRKDVNELDESEEFLSLNVTKILDEVSSRLVHRN